MKTATDFHKEGYNCAEAIIKSANEKFNLNIPIKLGSALGTGMAVGSTCGAITAAAVVLGHIKGRNSASEKNLARSPMKELMKMICENYGTDKCLDLKKNGISCSEIIDFVDKKLEDLIK
ncbi:C_GCAxxG_C_C family probable redox protein [Caloramator fervidus]|uniref:C_GCAxxG_C_C family probable redox protein n=1 Tax=Caloramator fervidus TaxID=29344 RepID=A0A1H5UAC3_9CLOT|nr:C-GCAxxG-C-C family (seleno)protein [Caloramator fervidus]SEF71271.1 C_GCAxxG_C_C family probable redox protein [Caloramator fervidus]